MFEMSDCNTFTKPSKTNTKLDKCVDEMKVDVALYKQIMGSLSLCKNIHDISYIVSTISRFTSEHKKSHIVAT